jgi:plasmid stabilization system protein ParE
MGSFTRTTRPIRIASAGLSAAAYVDRIAAEVEEAADAAEMARVKVARHGKATRKVSATAPKGGAR